MDHFDYRDGVLHAEDVPLPAIAQAVGTPVYVYSRATLTRHARVFRDALAVLPRVKIAFAVKSNPNLAVLRVLAAEGYGADVVSGGELERALAAGMAADGIVFSGVGKTEAEMRRALEAGSASSTSKARRRLELAALAASLGTVAPAALRVNPDVDAGTHGKISTGKAENKFGVPLTAPARSMPGWRRRPASPCAGWRCTSAASWRSWSRWSRPSPSRRPDARHPRGRPRGRTWTWAAAWACPTAKARYSRSRPTTRRWSNASRAIGT
jgi:diaminopimelate decarboxylase